MSEAAGHSGYCERYAFLGGDRNADLCANRPARHGLVARRPHQQSFRRWILALDKKIDVPALINLGDDSAVSGTGPACLDDLEMFGSNVEIDRRRRRRAL